jgi:hypothetical protein
MSWIIGILISVVIVLCERFFGTAKTIKAAVHQHLVTGLVVITLAVCIDFRTDQAQRFAELRAEMLKTMDTFVPGIQSGSNDDVKGTVLGVLGTYQHVKDNQMLMGLFSRELGDLNRRLRDIRDGRFAVAPEDIPQFMIRALETSRTSVQATSLVQFDRWWSTSFGSKYQELNKALTRRGVKVERIFIFHSREDYAKACPVLEEQKRNAIDVRFIVEPLAGRERFEDLIIVDDNLAGTLELTADREIRAANFYTDRYSIDDFKRKYQGFTIDAHAFEKCAK